MAALMQSIARQQNGSDYNEYIWHQSSFVDVVTAVPVHTRSLVHPLAALLYENWDVYRVLN